MRVTRVAVVVEEGSSFTMEPVILAKPYCVVYRSGGKFWLSSDGHATEDQAKEQARKSSSGPVGIVKLDLSDMKVPSL